MPERIKSSPGRCDELPVEEFERERSSSYSSLQSASPRASSYCESFGEDSGISTPMLDSVAFDEYRYGVNSGFPQAMENLLNKFHVWKNHGIFKTLNNRGKIMEFCEIIRRNYQ